MVFQLDFVEVGNSPKCFAHISHQKDIFCYEMQCHDRNECLRKALEVTNEKSQRNVAIMLSTKLLVMYNDKKRPSAQIYSQALNTPFGA